MTAGSVDGTPPARRLYRAAVRAAVGLTSRLGLNVARSRDYYSPLPSYGDLRRRRSRWDRPSALGGLAYDLEEMRSRVDLLLREYGADYRSLPSYAALKGRGYGPGFTTLDALFLYLMVRSRKPRRVVEVGSGLSTWYIATALHANAADGAPGTLVCIDPHVRPAVGALDGVTVVAREVQDVQPSFFTGLSLDDILFIDSTHVVKLDGDVPHLYLEVLPVLRSGVAVHAHDVHFPYNVPYPAEEYVLRRTWPMLWTEAMLVQAFLAFNPSFRVILSLPLLRHHDEDFLRRVVPDYQSMDPTDYDTHFGSLWFERVA